MKIKEIAINRLQPSDYNPRKNLQPEDPEYQKLKKSIEQFGYVEPIVFNERSGRVIGGHQRLKVLQDLGFAKVKTVCVDVDDNQERALNVALNKIQGEWDFLKLTEVLKELEAADFDIELTGFDQNDFAIMLFDETPTNAIGEKKQKPATMTLRFENPCDFRKLEDDLRALFSSKDVTVSIECGEV